MRKYFFQKILFVALGALLFSAGVIYLHSINKPSSVPYDKKIMAQASLLRPQPHYRPNLQHYVKVKLEIRENTDPLGDKIVSVQLGGHNIPLRPADPTGNRGTTHLQLKPGKYVLKWKVKKQRYTWPRYSIYKEEIDISPKTLWIDILLDGERVFVRY